mmetsp:Transcript_2694/g.10357  ORF Transcript_2694/g.10357 Transcript_2694/m.10357 type:complete len:121 (+) Transcript_2694:5372-5734(+)
MTTYSYLFHSSQKSSSVTHAGQPILLQPRINNEPILFKIGDVTVTLTFDSDAEKGKIKVKMTWEGEVSGEQERIFVLRAGDVEHQEAVVFGPKGKGKIKVKDVPEDVVVSLMLPNDASWE